MAQSSAGRRSPASAIWPLVAIVVIGVFLVWLAMTSEPSVIAAPEEASDTADASGAEMETAPVVAATEFGNNTATYVGQDIQLADVPVTSIMTSQILWVELPNSTPFLVKMDSALVSAGQAPAAQSRVTVVGRVLQKTDSVLDAWQASGALQNAGHRAQAEYGTVFIEARRIRPASGQE
jgi:hypothetical protein